MLGGKLQIGKYELHLVLTSILCITVTIDTIIIHMNLLKKTYLIVYK